MSKKNEYPKPYITYALAEKHKVDKDTKTSRPSELQVEEMRKHSIENKK